MKIIVGKTAGFCYGVKRATDGSLEQLKNNTNSNLYCLGELVHNKQVTNKLESKGLKFIDNIEDADLNNSKVILRAHGVTKNVYEYAKIKNIELVDYTCPNVLKIHKIARDYEKQGYYIFLTGTANHPEVIGIQSYCGKNFSLITTKDDIPDALTNLALTNIKKLLLISQTTYNTVIFKDLIEIIKNSLPQDIDFTIQNTICMATELRQKEVLELAQKVDAMIIIGGKNSSNTKKLYELASQFCKTTFLIETKDELDVSQFTNINSVGIMAGASTPNESINEVTELFLPH